MGNAPLRSPAPENSSQTYREQNMLELKKAAAPQLVELPELADRKPQGASLFDAHAGLINSLKVRLDAHVGAATITVAELSALKEGSLLSLDRAADAPLDILLDGKVVARGRLVAVDDSFGISITEIAAAAH
jgi:flagellar motor switch protein FliN